MVDHRYAGDIAHVGRELAQAVQERDRASVKIIGLQARLRALYALAERGTLGQGVEEIIGLTDAIRSVLRLAGKAMRAAEVKTTLDVMGFNFGGNANPSAAVHNTLKRMTTAGELTYTPLHGYRFAMQGGYIDLTNVPGRNFTEQVRNFNRMKGEK